MHDGHRELPTRQKARRIARERDQVGLRKAAHDPLRFERGDQRVDAGALVDEACEGGAEGLRGRAGKSADSAERGNPGAGRGGCAVGIDATESRARRLRRRPDSRDDATRAFVVEDEPVHPERVAGLAARFEKADLEHHLLRRRDLHGVDDRRIRRQRPLATDTARSAETASVASPLSTT